MDFVAPVEAIVLGAQGRVLNVLANTDAELSMRTVARLAGVSHGQASNVLRRLVRLGVVTRQEAGPSSLVRLSQKNEAARSIRQLANLQSEVMEKLKQAAKHISPVPVSLVLFGSFARGVAREASDIDVFAVQPAGAAAEGWADSLGRWSDIASEITGNPVNLVVVSEAETDHLTDEFWRNLVQDGVLLLGAEPARLRAAA